MPPVSLHFSRLPHPPLEKPNSLPHGIFPKCLPWALDLDDLTENRGLRTVYGRTASILRLHAAVYPSSETQGQLVGSIKCSWWKFTVRSRRARLDLYWAACAPSHKMGFRLSVSKSGLPGEGRHEGLVPRNDVLTNGFIWVSLARTLARILFVPRLHSPWKTHKALRTWRTLFALFEAIRSWESLYNFFIVRV